MLLYATYIISSTLKLKFRKLKTFPFNYLTNTMEQENLNRIKNEESILNAIRGDGQNLEKLFLGSQNDDKINSIFIFFVFLLTGKLSTDRQRRISSACIHMSFMYSPTAAALSCVYIRPHICFHHSHFLILLSIQPTKDTKDS